MTDLIEPDDELQLDKKAKAISKPKTKPLTALDPSVLQDVDVSLTAVVGKGVATVRQLLELSSGEVVDLDTPLDGRIELQLNGRVIALGELVAVEDKFGVRITQIVAEKE